MYVLCAISRNYCLPTRCDVGQVKSIDILPDEVLLSIFDFCAVKNSSRREEIERWWQTLVHVCRRWRTIVFASPHRLNLRLLYSPETPWGALDIWPPLSLIISDYCGLPKGLDNVIASLKHKCRVRQINLMAIDRRSWEKILAEMQEPFPWLTDLMLRSYRGGMPALPDSFLAGSAPRLRKLSLNRIPFPGLPKLLLSATQLVGLNLKNISQSAYISPETMVTALSALTSLESFHLIFQLPFSHPDLASRGRPPPTRSVLPVLRDLRFKGVNKGVSKYMEVFMAHIDTPRLGRLHITFSNRIVFNTSQLVQLICRTPRLKALKKACVFFHDDFAWINLSSPHQRLSVEILCSGLDRQLLSLVQVFTPSLPLSTLEDLYIYHYSYLEPDWKYGIEIMPWLELLHQFPGVKNLYLSKQPASCIALALQGLVGGRATQVMPSLKNIFLEGLQSSGPVQEGIVQFVAVRHATSPLISVTCWKSDEEDDDNDNDDDEFDSDEDDVVDGIDEDEDNDGGGDDGDDSDDGWY